MLAEVPMVNPVNPVNGWQCLSVIPQLEALGGMVEKTVVWTTDEFAGFVSSSGDRIALKLCSENASASWMHRMCALLQGSILFGGQAWVGMSFVFSFALTSKSSKSFKSSQNLKKSRVLVRPHPGLGPSRIKKSEKFKISGVRFLQLLNCLRIEF